MNAEAIADTFAEQQGWSDDTLRMLLYEFIDAKGLQDDLEVFLRSRAHAEEDECEDPNIPIKAESHSDDHVYAVKFDARPWFRKADDEDIVKLARCGWGGDYPADAVAEFMEDLDKEVRGMFEYVRHHQEQGFECYVEEVSAMKWLEAHRPEVAEDIEEENKG